jgi:U3 small nucleolar RNA-associated protein 21
MPSIAGEDFDLPSAKRQRVAQPQLLAKQKNESQSRIFSHFRVGGPGDHGYCEYHEWHEN